MGTLGVLLTSLAVAASRRIRDEYHCYAEDEHQYLFFGTKTSYAVKFKESAPPFQSQECSPPLMLWELVRHGTRYPMFEEHRPLKQLKSVKNRILRNQKIFNNVELCEADLTNLANWTINIPISESNRLTQQGKLDMESLAKRHLQRWPSLFKQYDPDNFLFLITESDRTNQSAKHFLRALFPDADIPQPEPNNALLRSYMNCSTWMLDYAGSRPIRQQRDRFHNSLLMSELVDRVSRRLGFFFDIRPTQVDAMYKMCAYDKAYKPHEISAWCAAFTEQELKILEYREDLLYYYKHGPGMDINIKVACPLLRDMILRLNATVNQQNGTTPVVIYFTHNGMFERFLSRLGLLNNSVPLTAQFDYNNTRGWRLAKYIPFAANLAVTLHNCTDGFKVAMYLNEKPLELENCTNGLCDWHTLYDKYHDIINSSTCNLNDCFVSAASPQHTNTFIILALLFLALCPWRIQL
ncbi:multiple inositol polyphosphate phosphatase 1-like [Macrosteles quadrilineatus]|uniref:multiple inositol polyphosphate phosphatase 1-like n=1 Tax=Macrosteles quadrilineatus TaxID=74068 RepID=UPI0023E25A86|nr:multiple inositol polyphosphate phosphatase 1-like [Macrosteles quadrilineatus]